MDQMESLWNQRTHRKHLFTEDGQLIRSVTFYTQTTSMSNATMKKYFQLFGKLESFRPRTKKIYTSGVATYVSAYDAGALLQCEKHYFAGFEIKVVPSYSRYQGKDQVEQTDDPKSEVNTAIEILDLNDDCLYHLFKMLHWKDLCVAKRTCLKFERIADYIFSRNYTSIDLSRTSCTLCEVWDLLDCFGKKIEKLQIAAHTIITENRIRVLQLVFQDCSFLRVLDLAGFIFGNSLYRIKSELFTNLQVLSLKLCEFYGDSNEFFARCRNIRKLSIQGECVPEQCLNTQYPFLEVAHLTTLDDIGTNVIQKIGANWKNLNVLSMNTRSPLNETYDMAPLSALKLEHFVFNGKIQPTFIESLANSVHVLSLMVGDLIDNSLTAILKCEHLRTLKLSNMPNMTDRHLKELATLPHLNDLHIIKCETLPTTAIIAFIKSKNGSTYITIADSGIEIDDKFYMKLVCAVNKKGNLTIKLYGISSKVNEKLHEKHTRLVNIISVDN